MSSISNVCPVVRIVAKNSDGFTEINESDFDSSIHKLYVAKGARLAPAVEDIDADDVPPPPPKISK